MTKSALEDIELFLKDKTKKSDFQKFFLIKKATKTTPAITLMINPQTDTTVDFSDSKIIWSGLGVIIPEKKDGNTFYESNNVSFDEFFKDFDLRESFLKTLTSEKEIQCEYEPKDSSYMPEEFDFDENAEEALEKQGYSPEKTSQKVEDTFFEIYNAKEFK